ALNKLLELRHDYIIAAVTANSAAQSIMNFFSAVQTQYHVMHFFVCKFDDVIINQQTVGSQCETEVFVVFFFHTAGIIYQLFHHIPVHERFAAEKVHFQISSAARVGNE